MKTKILILLALISLKGMSQDYNQKYGKRDKLNYKFATLGVDVRNGLVGSKPTDDKSALDFQAKLGAVSNNWEVSLFYERFERIRFQAYGVNVGYNLQLPLNLDLYSGIELGSIIRNEKENSLMCGSNLELRYHLNKRFVVGAQLNSRLRIDIWKKNQDPVIVHSGFLNLTVCF